MDAARKIKVLVIDDHPMVRRGLISLLEYFDDFEMVGDIADGRRALALCAAYSPDVVITDLLMPLMDGLNVTRLILNKFPRTKIIVLTSSVDEALIKDVLKAGATSYLLKTGSIDDIATAIRAAYLGTPTLAPEAVNVLISTIHPSKTIGADLTKREREILAFLVEGLHNAEIARHLFISPSTVKNHMGNIYSKLNTASRTKVVALAMQHNLFTRS
jgi:two-component system, NarL family, response regulator LiaR